MQIAIAIAIHSSAVPSSFPLPACRNGVNALKIGEARKEVGRKEEFKKNEEDAERIM